MHYDVQIISLKALMFAVPFIDRCKVSQTNKSQSTNIQSRKKNTVKPV